MMHPDIMRLMADERLATLRHDARRPAPRPTRSTPAVDVSEIDLRLCKASDDARARVPGGALGAAARTGTVRGCDRQRPDRRRAAACRRAALADPFVRTAHLQRLLELRAAQLRQPEPRRSFVPRYVSLIRGSTHA